MSVTTSDILWTTVGTMLPLVLSIGLKEPLGLPVCTAARVLIPAEGAIIWSAVSALNQAFYPRGELAEMRPIYNIATGVLVGSALTAAVIATDMIF